MPDPMTPCTASEVFETPCIPTELLETPCTPTPLLVSPDTPIPLVDRPDTPVPLTDSPWTPLLKLPEPMSLPISPARPLALDVLWFLVEPARPLPATEIPRMPGPVLLLSYSMHGRELEHVGSITPPTFAGCDL